MMRWFRNLANLEIITGSIVYKFRCKTKGLFYFQYFKPDSELVCKYSDPTTGIEDKFKSGKTA